MSLNRAEWEVMWETIKFAADGRRRCKICRSNNSKKSYQKQNENQF